MRMKKLKSRAGFTLVELMAVLLILVIATSLVAGGMPYIQKSYVREVDAANAGILLSTTMTVMRTELSTASGIEIEDSKISYISGETGTMSVIESGDTGIMITEHLEIDGGTQRLLISEKAASRGLHAEFGEVSYEDGIITVKDLTVYRADGSEVAKTAEFVIRVAGI